MEFEINKYLNANPEMKGFSLEFESKAAMGGGFECYIFSNKTHVTLVTGKNGPASNGDRSKVEYKHYCCRIGDDAYLKKFLEFECIAGNADLLPVHYAGFFTRLMDKVMSYGTKNSNVLPRSLACDGSGVADQHPEAEAVTLSYH